jgi:hypothetical protein
MTPPFAGTQDMIKADLDGDGDLDYAEIHFGDGRTHIYINNDGVFDATPSWTYDSTSVGNTVAAGDIDGNGRNDLVIGYSGNTSIVIFYAEDFPCPADIAGGDNTVNVNDLFLLLSNWNMDGPGASLAPPTDMVDVNDLFALLAAWGDC